MPARRRLTRATAARCASAPLGVLLADRPAALRHAAAEQSRITHLDPRCAAGAVAVAGAVALATGTGPTRRARRPSRRWSAWAAAEDACDRRVAGARGGVAARPAGGGRGTPARRGPRPWPRRDRGAGSRRSSCRAWRGVSTPSCARRTTTGRRSAPPSRSAATPTRWRPWRARSSGPDSGPARLPRPLLDRLTDRGAWGAAELERLARDCARRDSSHAPSHRC